MRRITIIATTFIRNKFFQINASIVIKIFSAMYYEKLLLDFFKG